MLTQENMLQRDRRWEIFYGEVSLEEFVDKRILKPIFRKEVHQDVKDSFDVVRKLLIHSYYEYLFIDVAVTRALHILEMALCIRYKELNNQEWGLKQGSLAKLLDWFNLNSHFDVVNPEVWKHIREVRNYLTHPKGHHFAGNVGLPWIHAVIDLINGLYDDVELRKTRWELTTHLGKEFESFLDNGGKLIYLDHIYYVYDVGSLKVENRLIPNLCYFGLLPLFDPHDTQPKVPLFFEYPLHSFTVVDRRIDLSFGSGKIYLTNDLNQEEMEKIAAFRGKLNSDQEYRVYNSMLIFETQNLIAETIRIKLNELYQSK